MGFLSKIWKGVKKIAKKIVKPIAKLFKPVTKFFNKFGVLGQIGMMFLMPYAFGALNGFATSALGKLGTWSQNLLSKAGWGSKALGHGLDLVHKAGTFVQNVYTGIADTISAGLERTGNFIKGRGFVTNETVLSNNFLAEEAAWESIPSSGEGSFKAGVENSLKDSSKAIGGETVPTAAVETDSLLSGGQSKIAARRSKIISSDNLFKTPNNELYSPSKVNDLKFTNLDLRPEIVKTPTGILAGAKNWAQRQLQDINFFNPESKIRTSMAKKIENFDLADTVAEVTVGGLETGGKLAVAQRFQEELYEGLGGELPEYTTKTYNIANMSSASYQGDYSVYDTFNTMQSANGNSWMSYNYSNAADISQSIDPSANYSNYMNQFGQSMYS